MATNTAIRARDSDTVGAFLAESCVFGPHETVEKGILHRVYMAWAGGRGMSVRAFNSKLAAREGIDEYRQNRARFWKGVGLLEPENHG